MLQKIREKTHGWFAWVLIGSIAVVFIFWGISGSLMSSPEGEVIVEVNGEKITERDLQTTFERLAQQQQLAQLLSGIQQPQINEQLIRNQALQALILEKVLTHQATKEGYAVSREMVDSLLVQMPQFQVNGEYSSEQYERMIRQLNFTPESFRETVKDEMMIAQAESTFTDSIFLLPYQLNNAVALVNQTRDVQYIIFTGKDFQKDVTVTDENIEAYYNGHQNEFMTPEVIKVSYVMLDKNKLIEKIKSTLKPSDQDLDEYYQNHIKLYAKPERRSARHILIATNPNAEKEEAAAVEKQAESITQQAREGASFAELAQEYSQDPGSASNGGTLGYFGRGEMVPAFEDAVFNAQQGEIVGPIKTEFGYHIILVEDIEQPEVQPFNEIKDELITQWYDNQIEIQFENDLAEMDQMAFENHDSLDSVAAAFDVPVQEMTLTSELDKNPELAQNQKVLMAIGTESVLVNRQNSDLVRVSPTQGAVFRVSAHEMPTLKPLDEVKDQAKASLVKFQGLLLARQKAQSIVSEFAAGMDPQVIAQQESFAWKNVKNLSRHNFDIPYEVVQAAFGVPFPGQPVITGMDIFPDQVVVVLINGVRPGELDKDFATEMLEEFQAGLAQFKARRDYNFYLVQAGKDNDVEFTADQDKQPAAAAPTPEDQEE